MRLSNTTRERYCIEERHGFYYDPVGVSEEERLIAKQLIKDAYLQRGLVITLADLGIQAELQADAEDTATPIISLPLPIGVIR